MLFLNEGGCIAWPSHYWLFTYFSGDRLCAACFSKIGQQTVTFPTVIRFLACSENTDTDGRFRYTYLAHVPSESKCAIGRDAGVGLSRDPLKNAERSQGPNLYEYVKNDPIDRLDPLGLKVYRCFAPVDVNPVANGAAKIVGAQHCWIKTDTVEAGMGPAGGGPLPASPCYGTQTAVIAQNSNRPGTTCEEIPDVDEDCVNKELQLGETGGQATFLDRKHESVALDHARAMASRLCPNHGRISDDSSE